VNAAAAMRRRAEALSVRATADGRRAVASFLLSSREGFLGGDMA